jgi:hypothetical protein
MLWLEPAQRGRPTDICDNLLARINEAEREGWHGEVDGLTVSLAAATGKLEQLDRAAERKPIALGLPAIAIPS